MRVVALLILLGYAGRAVAAGVDFTPLETFALEQMKRSGTPAVAVAVIVDNQVAYRKGLGVASIETNMPAAPDMLFRLGSTTKMFTAAAVLTLAEQGNVDLKAPIGKYVKGLTPRLGAVTLDQLLSHTAGIRDFAPMSGPHDDSELATRVRGLKDSDLPLEPGEIISYSNPGYWAAGMVLEEVSGKPFADAVEDRVLKPLGMTRSTFRPLVAMTFPLAIGHQTAAGTTPFVVRPFADDASTWPSGSLFSSVDDLSRFALAFMNGGTLDGKHTLSPFVIEKMSSPHAAIPSIPGANYGYGLILNRVGDLQTLSHGGARAGYGSTLLMAPQRKFAVIVLANRTGSTMEPVAYKAMEIALGIEAPRREPPAPAAITPEEAKRYAGKFSDSQMTVELIATDSGLVLRMGAREMPVQKLGANRFAGSGPLPEFLLLPGRNGEIEYLHAQLRTLRKVR
jgi:CubicO group peptidase (beta-lactamase class C family)